MMLEYPDFASIDDADVEAAYTRIRQLVAEYDEDFDTMRGALSDIVCELHAILQSGTQKQISDIRNAIDGVSIFESPDDVSDVLIDALASNYGVYRRPATRAHGKAVCIMSKKHPCTIRADDIFKTQDGRKFFVGPCETHSKSALDDKTTTVSFDLTAVAHGVDGYLPSGTLLTPHKYHRGFQSAYTVVDFQGGHDVQTNAEVMAQLPTAFAANIFSTRANIQALLNNANAIIDDAPDLSRIQAISVVGMDDPAMTRDQCGPLPISMGGCVDIYLRCSALPSASDDLIVKAAQKLLMHPTVRPPAISVVVQPAIPCRVYATVTLTDNIENRQEVIAKLSETVNNTGFSNRLMGHTLSTAISPHLPPGVEVSHIELAGEVTPPGECGHRVEGHSMLYVSGLSGVTENTVALYLDSKDILLKTIAAD